MISSSNPWVLAELQQALQQALPESDGLSEENSEKSCDRQDSSGEVVVVRVALPSATQREQEVIAVARELELHHQLSVADVSMLAELTGGRRAGLLDILKRVKQSSSAVTIAEACRATVDGEALALAATWGLLPRDAASGAVGEADKSREEWSPLWEAMGMLSVPSVVVGVNAAEGWLELSPAAPPGSGTILEDLGPHSPLAGAEHDSPSSLPLHDGLHRSPPLTVHAAIVPLESLSRGVDRSFVGVPPLRLAAYRRLFDRRSSTALPETSPGAAKDAGHRRSEGAAVYVGIGDDGGGLQHVGEGSNGTSDSRAGSRPAFGGDFVGGGGIGAAVQGESTGDWNGVGLQRAGGNKELERAGCLIEAGVLGRQHSREEAKLSEDRGALSTNWAELGTVRGDLEKEGKNDDTSDGEWAEVQLELIRQERAVVARANEMRARRARLDTLRRDIIDLEKHARLTRPLPPGNSREHRQHQDKFLVPPQPVPQEAESVALMPSGCRAGVGDEEPSWAAEFVEEEVIRDAETGVRLMPLLPTKRDREQDGSYSSLMSASGAVGSSDGGGSGDGGDGPKRRGLYGFGKLWRWIRGSR
ncbi:hypothetical protein Esi_0024_0189 [Ectocarpus siliculosus]|uniref:Uncharacterized protein n=1 Tax=Ectocarpus siliculosus TaxID=2880 RepID=D8LJB6_ECTSI|nr:hypothetical protein Esi_0024_0189 [Ectocarpus siliculosus]|eukprot:CBN77000.1 hypothetical protein Esi_0024_0189 [Ectocarpus siliculosus]